ncbi:MAG: OmpA family protein [Desulfobacterales bacterium]|jgi:outer membrane protein OmpA-like peptidoglycan-associated protein
MNKILKNFVILTVFFLIVPSLAQADIVYVKDDDRLYGSIQTPAFTIRTPYGKVRINYSFIKSLEYKHGSIGRWVVETINNDRFSGSLLEDHIRFRQENGNQKIIKKEQINRMQREFRGSSRQITTTIFTMQNGDRFCGTFLNSGLEMTMNYMTKFIQATEINRIEFKEDYPSNIKICLENGDLLEGKLKQNQFRLMPGAAYELSVAISNLKSIQFNAPKLVLREFSGSAHAEIDSDGDGIPDYADICMHTPLGVAVGQDGCAKKSMLAAGPDAKETSRKSTEKIDAQKLFPFETKNILFEFNRFDLKPQFFPFLDAVAARLEQNPNLNIEIHGHTDNIGSEKYNQNLSDNRARSVKNYFVSKGIKSERLIPEGFGFKIEKASNETEAGRALNRRVELAVQN